MEILRQIQALYRDFPHMAGGRLFLEDVALHLRYGYVWASPTAVILARPVRSDWGIADLGDLTKTAARQEADTWFVYLGAGNLAEFFEVMPYPLTFACFWRRCSPRFYQLEQLRRKCTTISSSHSLPSSDAITPASHL